MHIGRSATTSFAEVAEPLSRPALLRLYPELELESSALANDDHVARLMNSIKDWNEWREVCPELVDADLREADLTGANLSFADLRKSILTGAKLQQANLSGAKLMRAELVQAKLERADLTDADLRKANLSCANLQNAILDSAKMQDANLFNANLRDAKLLAANLKNANLRSASHLILDETIVTGASFGIDAQDPWSILRRNYSGSRLIFNLLFLVAFFSPYLAKVAFWAWVNRVQTYAEAIVNERTSAVGVDSGLIRNLSRCLAEQCDPMPAWQLIVGADKGWLFCVLAIALIAYNTLRAGITWRVASLREEEERMGCSPPWTGAKWWQNYRLLFWAHQYFVRWVFWIAIIAFIYNAYDWLTRTVWIPS